jgi:GAF domain-containing protein/HAMP domain-containing protein
MSGIHDHQPVKPIPAVKKHKIWPSRRVSFGSREMEKAYRYILLIMAAFCFTAAMFYIYQYFQSGIKQIISAVAITLASLLGAATAYWLFHKGKKLAAGLLMTASAAAAVGGSELVLKGLTHFHLAAAFLAILLVGWYVIPGSRAGLGAAMAVILIGLVLIDKYSPLPRFNASFSQSYSIYSAGVILLLMAILLSSLLRIIQRRSIRNRLVIAFLLLVLLPMFATTTFGSYLFRRTSQQQVINQLESVATLKAAEILSWWNSLEPDLYLAATQHDPDEQLKMLAILLGNDPASPAVFQDVYSQFKERFDRSIHLTGLFDELFIMNLNGDVVLSTDDSRLHTNQYGRDYFNEGLARNFVSAPFRSPETRELIMVAAIPFKNEADETIAILAGRVNFQKVNSRMIERAGMGETGETYLVSKRNILVTESRFEGYHAQETTVRSEGITTAVSYNFNGTSFYTNYRGVPVIGVYRWIPELQAALIAEQEQAEAFSPISTMLITNLVTAVAAVMLAIIAALFVTQRITRPLNNLGKTAERIASGDLNMTVQIEGNDEIGVLARSFNTMTTQLRNLIGDLEQRVAERTRALERRSLQFQVASEVARDATGLRDLGELLDNSVGLIRERFGFYHAGIFLLDERNEYAVLKAATGEAGRQMLASGFKLKVGEIGLVGSVARAGEPHVAMDVEADANHYKNPLLPMTRSEAAIPLKAGGRVTGVLDVQSIQEGAFDKETIEALQTMTDQLAVAIQNARLLEQMEFNMRELETAYGRYTESSWHRFLERMTAHRSYRYRGLGAEPADEASLEALKAWKEDTTILAQTENENESYMSVALPMKVRGQTIGVVNLQVAGSQMANETISLYKEIVDRLSLTLENVRLLEESQLRSEQLSLLQEITSEAVAHVDLEELFDSVTKKIISGLSLSRCSILMLDNRQVKGMLLLDQTANVSASDIAGRIFQATESEILQKVITARKSFVHDQKAAGSPSGKMHEFFTERGTQGAVIVPILSRGEVIGLLTMETDDPVRRFGDEDLRLADQISLQLSSAVDVARLFERTENRAERERIIRSATTQIRETLDIETVLKTAVKEMRQALNLAEVEVRLGPQVYTSNGRDLSLSEDEKTGPAIDEMETTGEQSG